MSMTESPGTRMQQGVDALNAQLKAQWRRPAVMREADAALELGHIMEMVNAGTICETYHGPVRERDDHQRGFCMGVFNCVKGPSWIRRMPRRALISPPPTQKK